MKIFKAILLLTFGFFSISCSSQKNLDVTKSTNTELVRVLNSSEQIAVNTEDYLSVRIYKIDNGAGSAGLPESHEVNHTLLIAVSSFDEYPDQVLYKIGPFFNPEFIAWTNNNEHSKEFQIAYGMLENRKTVNLVVDTNKLEYKD